MWRDDLDETHASIKMYMDSFSPASTSIRDESSAITP